jgi:hypothetical protein
MKEGSNVDHLSLAWQYPGQPRDVIPAKASRVARVKTLVSVLNLLFDRVLWTMWLIAFHPESYVLLLLLLHSLHW